jgi:hypothetical protein
MQYRKYLSLKKSLTVGVKARLLLGRKDRPHLERHNNRHLLDRLLGTMIHLEDLYFLHHIDMLPVRGLYIEHHLSNKKNLYLFRRIDWGLRTLDQQFLPLELGALAVREIVLSKR